ncbi:unnamed protein product [Calicophoron daubneyi]|uniref:Migration and invasion enhancer 1 n=1 Tax=Calicophoron daubneyi TaxID=300641 RepID=A0AAV2TUH8_CALDB
MSAPTECKIHIEHCDDEGFHIFADYICDEVKKQVPEASAEIVNTGPPASFEVTVNGTLVSSRTKSKSLPIPDNLVEEIVAIARGKKPEFFTKVLDESKDCKLQ